MRMFPFVIHSHLWHSSPSLNKNARQKAVPTNSAKNISTNKQTVDTFLAMRMVLVYSHWSLTNVRLLLKYFCYGLNVNENKPSHRFSVVIIGN